MRLLRLMIYSQSQDAFKAYMSQLAEENDSPVVHVQTKMDYNAINRLKELGNLINGR